jgi:hypothetical protein
MSSWLTSSQTFFTALFGPTSLVWASRAGSMGGAGGGGGGERASRALARKFQTQKSQLKFPKSKK